MAGIGTFHDLFGAIRRQLWLMALVLAIGLPGAWWFAKTRPRVYEAIAVMQIEPAQVRVGADAVAAPVETNAELDMIRQALMARGTMQEMIATLGLFPQAETDAERLAAARQAVTITKIVDPAQAWRPDAAASGLSIAVRLDDPDQAAAYANALLDWIVDNATARTQARADRTLQFLIAEESRINGAIDAVEARIAEFRAENIASLPDGLTSQRDRLADLQDQRLALQTEAVAGDTTPLRSTEVERRADRLREQQELLDAAIAEADAAIAAAPAVEQQLAAMNRELDALEAELAVITTRRAEAAMQATLQANDDAGRFSTLERAEPPDYAVSADRRKVALAGAVAVMALAAGLGLAREILQPALRTAVQMKRQTGLDPVVVIPMLRGPGYWRRRMWRAATVAAALAVLAVVLVWPGSARPWI